MFLVPDWLWAKASSSPSDLDLDSHRHRTYTHDVRWISIKVETLQFQRKKICNAATLSHFGNPKSNPWTHHTRIHLANLATYFRDNALSETHLSRSKQPLTWNIPTFQETHSTFTHNLNSNIAQAGSCQNLKNHTPPSTQISYNGCRTATNLQIWATLCPPHRMRRIADFSSPPPAAPRPQSLDLSIPESLVK